MNRKMSPTANRSSSLIHHSFLLSNGKEGINNVEVITSYSCRLCWFRGL